MKPIKKIIILSTLLIFISFGIIGGCGSNPPPAAVFFTDIPSQQLSAYYDLRDRSSYIQVTNVAPKPVAIHVQIFQNDKNCDELDFNDNLTPNDTVIYNLDDIKRNDGSEVPVNLNDDSNGYVVITIDSDSQLTIDQFSREGIIGNFRIIDSAGYEYRANLAAQGFIPHEDTFQIPMIANFNTASGANLADVIGYTYVQNARSESSTFSLADTVTNFDEGVDFDIFVYDMEEDPLSCDRLNFSCGSVMNYGINEDYKASRGDDLLCPGGSLADPKGGFISFENGKFGTFDEFSGDDDDEFEVPTFVGLIGINNGNGTGSIDYWFIAGDEFIAEDPNEL